MSASLSFADLVATSDAVAATRARSRKIELIADLLERIDPDELPIAVALLIGEPRQGKIGIGWRTIRRLEVAPAAQPALTVGDIDASLEALAGIHGPGSQARRAQALDELFGRATSVEQWFLRRLLVGELRQGALAGVVTDAVARSAGVPQTAVRRATMLAGDLPQVARVAHCDGLDGLTAVGLTVLRPVQPMLAQTAADVVEALDLVAGMASVEWKLDGARIQVHRDADVHTGDVRIYTRNLNDVTAQLPEVVALVRSLPARRLVLDGEAVGWGEDERPDLFQDVMSRLTRDQHDRGGEVPVGMLQARFFDILHVDGQDLVDRPLTERLDALEHVAGPWRIKGRLTDDPAVAREVLDEALAHGHEGVMVKAAASLYEAGRRGGAWRKVKPVKTLDLVVLAAEWGSGRRRGWLSNLHLGARDPDAADGELRFVMVGKTFKGLTDELLTWQTQRFQELATRREDHVVYVRPELVVEIALDGVQVSTRYPGGVALRFARVKRYRPDKTPAEADTIDAVRALFPVTP